MPISFLQPGLYQGYPQILNLHFSFFRGKLMMVAQTVKNPLAMWETWVRSLGWEDPLEESMATHSNILLENPHGQRSLAGYSLWGRKESDTTE